MTLNNFINIFAVIGGLLALFEFGRAAWRLYSDSKMFSWSKIQKASEKLFDQISTSQFRPDLIIGLGRGGTIAAGLLAAHFRESSQYGFKMIPIASIDRFYLLKKDSKKKGRCENYGLS